MFIYLFFFVDFLILFSYFVDCDRVSYRINLINTDDYPNYNKKYLFYYGVDNLLINRQLPVIQNIQILNKNFTSDFLLNTGSVQTWVASSYCQNCLWSQFFYESLSKRKIIENTFLYSFGIVSGFTDSDNFSINFQKTNFTMNFISIINAGLMNSQFKFSGMLGLGLSSDKNINFSFADKLFTSNGISRKILSLKFDDKNATMSIGDLPQEFAGNITTCAQIPNEFFPMTNNYWACKMDYILVGDEYDFYLTKRVDQYVLFDSLSFFHFAPYDLLEYFMKAYFLPSDQCLATPLDYNETTYSIQCIDDNGLQKFKSLNVILNGWAYKIGSKDLFDTEDFIFNAPEKKNYYYFKVLFSKNRSGWTLGTSFFRKYFTSYDYDNKTLLFYGPDRYNFTKYTSETIPEDNSIFVLFLSISAVFLSGIIILLWTIFYIKQRRILLSYELNQKKLKFE